VRPPVPSICGSSMGALGGRSEDRVMNAALPAATKARMEVDPQIGGKFRHPTLYFLLK
jgi:hypothetical protein